MAQSLKPPALRPGDAVRILSLSSPVQEDRAQRGCEEIVRLGYTPKFDRAGLLARDGFFSGGASERLAALHEALSETATRAIFGSRGGYGSNYLLDGIKLDVSKPKILVGYSDLTSLQIFLWQKFRWVTFYGPMAASGLDCGADASSGYDAASLSSALTEAKRGWRIDLQGEPFVSGAAEGVLLGGCLTLVETTLGTPWELDSRGSILILEDRGMKPWQVDRALMHLKQAGKLKRVAGIILGDFPECEAPADTETVKEVAQRILAPLGVPIVWGAAVGHTSRPMLTLPLGVRARLTAGGKAARATQLEILEPAVS